jgi:hypothetical protein
MIVDRTSTVTVTVAVLPFMVVAELASVTSLSPCPLSSSARSAAIRAFSTRTCSGHRYGDT